MTAIDDQKAELLADCDEMVLTVPDGQLGIEPDRRGRFASEHDGWIDARKRPSLDPAITFLGISASKPRIAPLILDDEVMTTEDCAEPAIGIERCSLQR